jgi:hypothetical protein
LNGAKEAFRAVDLTVQSGSTVEHNFGWEQEFAWISGTLSIPEGIPQSKAWVSAEAEGANAAVQRDTAEVSKDGTFRLEVSPGASYRLNQPRFQP